jgi:hypothetical protein
MANACEQALALLTQLFEILIAKPMSIKPYLVLLALLFCKPAFSQLLFVDFNETETLNDYISATTPANRLLNAIGSSGAGVQASISQKMLNFTRSGSNTGSFSRTTNFSGSPQALALKLQLKIADNTSAQTTAAVLQIGSGFGTSNTAESNSNVHSRVGINFTANTGEFTLRDLGTSTNSSSISGTQNILWVINNTGSPIFYRTPTGGLDTLVNDAWDLWAGNTKLFNDRNALTTSQTLDDFKFAFTNGSGKISFDQIQVDVPSSLNHFRSAVANGNWFNTAHWEMSLDSQNWVAANVFPAANAASIHIRSLSQFNFSQSSNPIFCAVSNLLISANAALKIGSLGDSSNLNTNHIITIAKQGATADFINNGQLQVNENAHLQCKGILQNNASFIVKSSAAGTGNIGNSNGGSIIGTVSVERYIPAHGRRNRSLSTPISNNTLQDWHGEIFITGNGIGNTLGTTNSNGFDATLTNNTSVFWYNETDTGNVNLGWKPATNINNPLVPGRGYKVMVRGDRSDLGRLNGTNNIQNAVTLVSTGTINHGDFTFPSSNVTWSGGTSNDGWCFVGNPYPASINWNAITGWQRTNIDAGAIAIWNPQTNSYAYSVNTAGGANPAGLSINGGSGIIASHQAFFVRTTGSNPSLGCNENVKSSSSPSALFKNNHSHMIKIGLEKEIYNKDEAIIRFDPSYSETEIEFEDLAKLNNPIVNVGTGLNPKRWLAFNALPLQYGEAFSIPIYAEITDEDSALLIIELKEEGNFQDMVLTDLLNKKHYNLGKRFEQKFSFKSIGSHQARFLISGRHTILLGNVKIHSDEFIIYPNPFQNEIWIKNGQKISKSATVEISDLTGKTITNQALISEEAGNLKIDLNALTNGIYLLQIKSAEHTIQQKIIKQ